VRIVSGGRAQPGAVREYDLVLRSPPGRLQ
jgi:hypothetical protein